MANVISHDRFLATFLPSLIFALTALTSATAEARPITGANNLHPITLSAPDSVRELLDSHFELPDTPPLGETDRATFMRRALREVGDLLATEGYFTPTVTLSPAGLDGVQVLKVVLGPRTLVAQLKIEFTGDLAADDPYHRARVEKLRAAWPLDVGVPFRSSAWDEAKASLLSNVAREDYAAAQITLSETKVDSPTARAQLMVVVDSGPAFRFGELAISGLDRYDKNLVVRQVRFHTGDPYRRDLLLTFQARLQNLPQFSSVIVNIEPDISTHEAAPVTVVITEAKPRRVALGVGYSSNNGARSEINYLNHNFADDALNLSSGLRLEQNRQTLSTDISTVPDENGYVMTLGAVGEATHIAGLRTARDKLGVTRSHTLGMIETRLGLNFQQEHRQPAGGIDQINQALVPDWQWHRRAIDDPLYPRRGNVTELRVGGGNRRLMSNNDFLRSYARHQIWWPIGERDVFSLRGEAGFTAASSSLGIPQEYLFRAGGSQSVRGYAYQSLGVLEGAAIVGGRALLTSSIEYTHWFSGNWGAAFFTDAGGAADNMKALRMLAAYGGGIRWRSPAGPLALDLAWGLKSRAMRMHFSIAVVF